MKVLFLAPQPFFAERGTPIAVKLALNTLSKNQDLDIDLVVYPLGEEIEIERAKIHRSSNPLAINSVSPGLSFFKLLLDISFALKVLALVFRNRDKGGYHLLHAVEESVFIAWLVKKLFGIPYIYDMDSALTQQSAQRWKVLKFVEPFMKWLEGIAIKEAILVLPMCDDLAELARSHGAKEISVLRDVSLLEQAEPKASETFRVEFGVQAEEVLGVYVGNLEPYQGIDLLLEKH